MSTWLDLAFEDRSAATVAEGFGAVFTLMRAVVDDADLSLLRSYDEEWASVGQSADPGRIDDLGDLVANDGATLIRGSVSGDQRTWDALRTLRAVYRFGLLAWALDAPESDDRSWERWQTARTLAAHFSDAGALTFVAGKAIEVSHDRRVAWWGLLMQPRGPQRVLTVSFVPALVVAYLSVLMDLLLPEAPPETLDLPSAPWLEKHQTELRDGIKRAWPLNREPSFWQGPAVGAEIANDPQVGHQRRRAAEAIGAVVEEMQEARAARVRQGAVRPDRRDLFVSRAQRAWGAHRTLGPSLRALGAPEMTGEMEQIVVHEVSLPKAAFVGEGSELSVETYGEDLGRRAAAVEGGYVVRQLLKASADVADTSESSPESAEPDLVRRALTRLRAMRDRGYSPSLVLTPTQYGTWGPVAVDRSHLEEDQQRLRDAGAPDRLVRMVRGRLEDVVVASISGLDAQAIVVIDASRALATPARFDPSGADLLIDLSPRDPAEVRASIREAYPEAPAQTVTKLVNDELEALDVHMTASIGYELVDSDAVAVVWI